jgi:hypothetical protein
VNRFRINYEQLPFTVGPYSYEYIASRVSGKWRILDANDNACGSAEDEESAKEAVLLLDRGQSPERQSGTFEPDGGNLYRPHFMQVHSGRFWRCKHGRTGFKTEMKWGGCWRCAVSSPVSYFRFNFPQRAERDKRD